MSKKYNIKEHFLKIEFYNDIEFYYEVINSATNNMLIIYIFLMIYLKI